MSRLTLHGDRLNRVPLPVTPVTDQKVFQSNQTPSQNQTGGNVKLLIFHLLSDRVDRFRPLRPQTTDSELKKTNHRDPPQLHFHVFPLHLKSPPRFVADFSKKILPRGGAHQHYQSVITSFINVHQETLEPRPCFMILPELIFYPPNPTSSGQNRGSEA